MPKSGPLISLNIVIVRRSFKNRGVGHYEHVEEWPGQKRPIFIFVAYIAYNLKGTSTPLCSNVVMWLNPLEMTCYSALYYTKMYTLEGYALEQTSMQELCICRQRETFRSFVERQLWSQTSLMPGEVCPLNSDGNFISSWKDQYVCCCGAKIFNFKKKNCGKLKFFAIFFKISKIHPTTA